MDIGGVLRRLFDRIRSRSGGSRGRAEARYPGVTRSRVREAPLIGWTFEPGDDGPHPGVLVLHGSEGRAAEGVAALLADRGFFALALQYFGVPGLPRHLAEVPVEYAERAAAWLADRESVAGDGVGVYGSSKGAELGLAFAALTDRVGAVVGVAPSAFVFEAFGGTGRERLSTSCWTAGGDPLPYVPFDDDAHDELRAQTRPITYRGVYERSVAAADPGTLDRARIPVRDVDCPVLLVSGGDDRVWPASRFATLIEDRAADSASGPPVDHRQYEDAGHVLALPHAPALDDPVSAGMTLGGTEAGNRRMREDAWPRVFDAFGTALR